MRTPHNEHPQSLHQKMGWDRRAPECLAFPRETEQKPAHWHKRESCSTRHIHANFALVRRIRGICLGLANCRRNDCVLADHLPSTSLAKTTNLALPCSPDNSRYARSFLRRALSRAAPSSPAHRACGVPSRRRGETSVMSRATCAPWNNGNPSATTSRRRGIDAVHGQQVQIPHHDICLAPASRHKCGRALQSEPPTSQDPCLCATRPVVAKHVEWTATPAGARGQGEGEPQAAQEQHAEELGKESERDICGDGTDSVPSHGT